ncbi:MAG: flagellar biosynthesis protein FlhB [Acidobacteria bacterium]|nr:flagellar biosynthesis protein FlhB [Acidobacteriota bacterium]
MAFDPSRTEKATPKRRQKAREEGSFPKSVDLDSALILWGNYFLLLALGGFTVTLLAQQMAQVLRRAQPGVLGEAGPLLMEVALQTAKLLLPFLAANLALALLIQAAQRGLHFHAKPLQPKFERLNPATGFGRLFSAKAAVDTLKSLAKFLVLAAVAWGVIGPRIPALLATVRAPLGNSMDLLRETLFILYRDVMLAMAVIALADFLYQRHHFEKSIRMTKQEVKDEMKDAEQSPEIRQRQRSLMLNAAQRRMLAAVPRATVVITNPTHYAVALRYDPGTPAPLCVAKGVDFMAFRIREKARAAGVTMVENPPLARILHGSVRVDRPIPKELYQAVAQVLAYVYRLRGAA